MSTASILLLTKEVSGLSDVPVGPERAAACARPRRHFWEVVSCIQRSLRSIQNAETLEPWQTDRLREVRECCSDLIELIPKLQEFDRGSGMGHWAATEYIALTDEVQRQQVLTWKLLGEEETEEAVLVTSQIEATLNVLAKDTTLSQEKDGSSSPHGSDSTATTTPKPGEVLIHKPVRLTMEDLHSELHNCAWSVNGTCPQGCTVGGCKDHDHLVQAW